MIAELRGRERVVVLLPPPPPAPLFSPSDRVCITDGPLVGFSGLVAGMRPHQRVALLLQLLGRVEIAARAVERIA